MSKPFIRVRDRLTGHQYDVHEDAFNGDKHEQVKRVPRSKVARPAKPNMKPKTSVPVAVEGVSPAGD